MNLNPQTRLLQDSGSVLDISKPEDANLIIKRIQDQKIPLSLLQQLADKFRLSQANSSINFGKLGVFVDNPSLVQDFQYSLGNKNFYFNYGYVTGCTLVVF